MLNAILIMFGAVMFWAGWQGLKEQRRLKKVGVETEARVVEVKQFEGRHSQVRYIPVWAFKDEAGTDHRLPMRDEGSTRRGAYKVGDTIRVIYDPNSPDRVHGVGAKQNLGFVIYLAGSLGLIGYGLGRMTGLVG